MTDRDDLDPIIIAGDDGEILGDGHSTTVRCYHCGREFERNEAAGGFFDGDDAWYQCPRCGTWTEGPPPD